MPSVAHVENFQRLLGALAHAADTAVRNTLPHFDTADQPAAYASVLDKYLAASAQVSAHWYHSLAPDQPFAARPAPLVDASVLSQNVQYAQSTDDVFGALTGTTERHVYETSAATIVTNADREHVRYARYASATACAFCRLLSTRTAHLYRSEQTALYTKAGTAYHDHCHCVAVPIRPGDSYAPPDYVKQWQDDYTAAQRDPDVHGFDEIVNHMRRAEYARQHAPAEQPAEPSVFGGLTQQPAEESVFAGLSL